MRRRYLNFWGYHGDPQSKEFVIEGWIDLEFLVGSEGLWPWYHEFGWAGHRTALTEYLINE